MNESSIFIHEIKNSLSNIYSLVEIIEKDPSESRECLPLIKTAINQIKNIERDYDEYRNSGKTTVKLSQVNIASLLGLIADEHKAKADERKVTIQVICKNIKIQTDLTKLKQVLTNLITNAIKYNQIGGQILLEGKLVNNRLVISVSDTGIGMSPEEIKSLGIMFFRSKKNNAPGTGLGWSLIKAIASSMGWEINIKSKTKPCGLFEFSTVVSVYF